MVKKTPHSLYKWWWWYSLLCTDANITLYIITKSGDMNMIPNLYWTDFNLSLISNLVCEFTFHKAPICTMVHNPHPPKQPWDHRQILVYKLYCIDFIYNFYMNSALNVAHLPNIPTCTVLTVYNFLMVASYSATVVPGIDLKEKTCYF